MFMHQDITEATTYALQYLFMIATFRRNTHTYRFPQHITTTVPNLSHTLLQHTAPPF